MLMFKEWMKIYTGWEEYGHAMMIKYETFIENKVALLLRMMKYMNINLSVQTINKIIEKHDKGKESKPIFNKVLVDGGTFNVIEIVCN